MSKQEAINLMASFRNYLTAGNPIWDVDVVREAFDMAIQLLENSPEITRCEDCKWCDEDYVCQNPHGMAIQGYDDYCSLGLKGIYGNE